MLIKYSVYKTLFLSLACLVFSACSMSQVTNAPSQTASQAASQTVGQVAGPKAGQAAGQVAGQAVEIDPESSDHLGEELKDLHAAVVQSSAHAQ